MQNGIFQSFNRRLRDELLTEVLFSGVPDARVQIRAWQHVYNHHRSHSGLENILPSEFCREERTGHAGRPTPEINLRTLAKGGRVGAKINIVDCSRAASTVQDLSLSKRGR